MDRDSPLAHHWLEDVYALTVGGTLILLGLSILKDAGLITGGVAGFSLLLSQWLPLPVGVLLALINLPFLYLSLRTMGTKFTVKTVAVNAALAAFSFIIPILVHHSVLMPAFAALVGGSVIGMGALALARHGAGIGGFGIVALYLFRARGWNAGRTQMLLDCIVLLLSLPFTSWIQWLWSVASAVAINGIIFVWHRPGRYAGY